MKIFFFLTFFLCYLGNLYCQSPRDKQLLYIATDKDIYTNNETIWFAGYVLMDIPNGLSPDILTVCLINSETNKIELQKKYAMKNGLCSGSLLLPDSISSGS